MFDSLLYTSRMAIVWLPFSAANSLIPAFPPLFLPNSEASSLPMQPICVYHKRTFASTSSSHQMLAFHLSTDPIIYHSRNLFLRRDNSTLRIRRLRRNPPLVSLYIPIELLHPPCITHPQALANVLQHGHIMTDHQDPALEVP